MFGLGTITDIFDTPIDKVQRSVQSILYKEIRKNRMSGLRDNLINQPTFIGIAPKLQKIDEEGTDTYENTMASQTIYADMGDGTRKPLVYISQEWVEHLSDAQTTELLEHVLSQNLTAASKGEVEVITEDLTGMVSLPYEIIEGTVTEVEAKVSEASDEDSTSTDDCDIPGEDGDDDSEDEEEESSKTTEDTVASFTKLADGMTGDIKNFVSHTPKKQTEKDVQRIREVQDILEDGMRFQGRGRAKTVVPSKRLNMKAIITEASENEYIGKKEGGGKRIKLMVTIDRSGSMSGQPTTESNVLISALNNMVLDNIELDVEVMLSYTGAYTKFKLPVGSQNSDEIWQLTGTGDAEYLWQNMQNNMESLTNADINLVYTDGSICDDPIDKVFLDRRNVTLSGLYVSDAMGVDNIRQHYSRNKMYFHNVIVRPSIQELTQEISNKIFMERSTR